MNDQVAQKLLDLNREFYHQMAAPFARSRVRPQPGFSPLLDALPQPGAHLLDVGCGDGRLGRFLLARRRINHYTGVDFSADLLTLAQSITVGDFYHRDLSRAGCLDGLGLFAAVACLATLQHLPGRANRLRLLREMAGHLSPDGHLILSNWQFLDNPRQRRKIVDWSEIGLTAADVEAHDYLLTWQRDAFGRRYVCLIDAAETAVLAQEAHLEIVNQYRSDGREGDLNLYTILKRI